MRIKDDIIVNKTIRSANCGPKAVDELDRFSSWQSGNFDATYLDVVRGDLDQLKAHP